MVPQSIHQSVNYFMFSPKYFGLVVFVIFANGVSNGETNAVSLKSKNEQSMSLYLNILNFPFCTKALHEIKLYTKPD